MAFLAIMQKKQLCWGQLVARGSTSEYKPDIFFLKENINMLRDPSTVVFIGGIKDKVEFVRG